MNTEEIKQRNLLDLQLIITRYKLKYTLEDILSFQSVFIDFKEDWAFRVFATSVKLEAFEDFDDNENIIASGEKLKQSKYNLFNFLKKMVSRSYQEEIYAVREDFICFVIAWNQLRLIRDLEHTENALMLSGKTARDQFLEKLTYK
jgi:hypothetical protein